MTILLVAQVFPPRTGGSGRWMWELYRRLSDVDMVVAAGRCEGDRAFDAQSTLRIERVPLDFASWGLLSPHAAIQYARTLNRLSKLVAVSAPAQIHCAKALPEGLLGLALHRLYGVPFTCYAHGEELRLASTSRELRALTRRVLDGAATVIANSSFTRQVLTSEWTLAPSRVNVMAPGADMYRFTPASPDPAQRERLGWSGRRVILTVGTMQRRKGQDTMIRALPAVRAVCPDVLYVIAGPALEYQYLAHTARECGVEALVQFRENTSDDELIACYQQCDVFTLPNRQVGWDVEGFGMVLVEAQGCGKPVIAGRSGGTIDAVQDGVTGELIDASNVETVAAAVIRMLTSPDRASTMGLRARAWAVERFDWTALVPQALKVFDSTMPGASRGVQAT